jgi:hypothetical protein
MVFTWFSHILYYEASLTVHSTYLLSENSATSQNDTKLMSIYSFFIEIAGPSKTNVNTIQIKPLLAFQVTENRPFGGLQDIHSALTSRLFVRTSVTKAQVNL